MRWHLNIVWIEYTPEKPLFKIVDYETASRNGEPFQQLIKKRSFLPNVVTRFCTGDLKVKPMKRFMKSLGLKRWNVIMGIRFDEPQRWVKYVSNNHSEPFWYMMPMYDWGTIKPDVLKYWNQSDFDLQIKDDEGNCDLCFLKGKAKLIRLLKAKPEKADWWIGEEIKTQGTFRKGNSYAELLHVSKTQTGLFDDEELEMPCHCTID